MPILDMIMVSKVLWYGVFFSSDSSTFVVLFIMLVSLVVTGIGQKTFSLKATHGSFRPSRTPVYVGVAVLVFQVG